MIAFSDGTAVRYPVSHIRSQSKKIRLLPLIKLPPQPVSGVAIGDTSQLLLTTSDEKSALIAASLVQSSDAEHLHIEELLQMKRGVRLASLSALTSDAASEYEAYRKRTLPAIAHAKNKIERG